jgi:hypothetical protein
MYQTLTFYHSLTRWLVLASLCLAIYRGFKGYFSNAAFTSTDNAIRHWTATLAHIQLVLGVVLYFQSPIIQFFWSDFQGASENTELVFFGAIHSGLMLVAIVVLTIGSAVAKRKTTDKERFSTMMVWFSVALLIIFIAIPWPFSPLASRPFFR